MSDSGRRSVSRERLGQIIWDLGHCYPVVPRTDQVSISMVHPRLGYLCWHMDEDPAGLLRQRRDTLQGAKAVARIYDVTDIIFDGHNAHAFFDIDIAFSGNYYFTVDRTGRNYLAELGLRAGDGLFSPIARSGTAFFGRDRSSGNYQVNGLFVGSAFNKIFTVDNMFDAPVYEKMYRELLAAGGVELSAAVVFLGMDEEAGAEGPLGSFVRSLSGKLEKFGGRVRLFSLPAEEADVSAGSLLDRVRACSKTVSEEMLRAYEETPFHLVHCHDWYSSLAGIATARALKVPMILSLHSTEYERLQGNEMSGLSSGICRIEEEAVHFADLVIVPHSSTRQQAINLYGAVPEKTVIVPDILREKSHAMPRTSEVKSRFGLNPDAPTILFSGEISHACGADILVDALGTVCRNHRTAQFVFAGDGPLKRELQYRVQQMGVAHRCRFLGDVTRETFEALLIASDFVVIPARTWQDEGLAQMALLSGRPVLTTRQAGLNCVLHGQNGLVTFDNPGSIVWGIQELLSNPLQGNMLRLVAAKRTNELPSVENVAAQQYTYYGMIVKTSQEGRHV